MQISAADRELLASKFTIDHPSNFGPMVSKIDVDTPIERVEMTYNVRAEPWERDERWVSCSVCGTSHNHLHGFVVRLGDGNTATVGKECGEKKHQLIYSQFVDSFEAKRTRARSLLRMQTATRLLPSCVADLTALLYDPGFAALLELERKFRARFPSLHALLSKFSDGRLMGTERVRDFEEERARDGRLERKLQSLANRLGVSRDAPGADAALLAQLHGDQDAAKAPIMKPVVRELGLYSGTAFISVLPSAMRSLESKRGRIAASLDTVSEVDSATLSTSAIATAVGSFTTALRSALDEVDAVFRAVDFCEPQNLAAIVAYATKVPKAAKGPYTRKGNVLSCSGGSSSLDLTAPVINFSATSLRKAISEIENIEVY